MLMKQFLYYIIITFLMLDNIFGQDKAFNNEKKII